MMSRVRALSCSVEFDSRPDRLQAERAAAKSHSNGRSPEGCRGTDAPFDTVKRRGSYPSLVDVSGRSGSRMRQNDLWALPKWCSTNPVNRYQTSGWYPFEAPSPATRGARHARGGRLGARDRRAKPSPPGAALENQFRCCDCGPRADCSPSSISDGLLHSFDRARRATSPAPRSPRSRRRTPRPWACGTPFLFAAPADLGTYGPCRYRQGPQCLDPRARI